MTAALGVKHVSGGEVSAVNAVVAIVMANAFRAHVSPVSAAPHGNLPRPSA